MTSVVYHCIYVTYRIDERYYEQFSGELCCNVIAYKQHVLLYYVDHTESCTVRYIATSRPAAIIAARHIKEPGEISLSASCLLWSYPV